MRPISARRSSIWAPARRPWRYSSAAVSFTRKVSRWAATTSPLTSRAELNTSVADAERIKTFYGSVLIGGSDERDMITVPPIGEDEREQVQFVPRSVLVTHHQAARRRNSGNGARPAGGVVVRRRAARARDPHRRRKPDDRIVRTRRPQFSNGRCASAGRLALPGCRTRPRARHLPPRPGFWFIRRRRISNISKHAAVSGI